MCGSASSGREAKETEDSGMQTLRLGRRLRVDGYAWRLGWRMSCISVFGDVVGESVTVRESRGITTESDRTLAAEEDGFLIASVWVTWSKTKKRIHSRS